MMYFIRGFFLCICVSFLMVSCTASLPNTQQSNKVSADAARGDLTRLYEGLRAASANLYAETPQHVFEARYTELMNSYTAPVPLSELHKDFQQFSALARLGHTRIEGLNRGWSDYIGRDGRVFPLGFQVVQGDVRVMDMPAESKVQLLDKIVAINGMPTPIWLDKFRQNISAETSELAYTLMRGGESYFAWLVFGELPEFTVTLERDGRGFDATLSAITLYDKSNNISLEKGFVLSGREAKMVAPSVAYLRPGAFYNLEAKTSNEAYAPEALAVYKAFIDTAFEDFIAKGAKHLILDLRDNSGGDSSYSDLIVAWFADKPFRFASDFRIRVSEETIASNAARLEATGSDPESVSGQFAKLYEYAKLGEMISYDLPYAQPREGKQFNGSVHVLINRMSFSNAVTTAALLQDYGFGTIYGEPTQDMATTYGAMEHFTLPNTGFKVGYPKAHIIRANGREDSHPVTPDVSLPAPALRGAEDVRLESLIAHLTDDSLVAE